MPELAMPVSPERDHIQGRLDAPLTLLEYGDYQCPYCGAAYLIVKQIQERFGEQLRFIFRHFYFSQIHPQAQQAAEAVEAAGAQGRFWEMHDMLFEHQPALDEAHLTHYAAAIGLDMDRFEREMADHTYAGRVRDDFLAGLRSGVKGTSTFFINGHRHDGASNLASLVAALQLAIDEN